MTIMTEDDQNLFRSPELLDPATPYEKRRDLLMDDSRTFLEQHRSEIQKQHEAGASGRQVVGSLTSMTDTLLRNIYRVVTCDLEDCSDCALIAIGGYGRAELNPRSDIDLMFYYQGKSREIAETISERLLYLAWDLNFDVGYSVRNAKDCLEMADNDVTVRTALLDSRLLVGEDELFDSYLKSVVDQVLKRNPQGYIKAKLQEIDTRREKYGSSVFLLEPNIKEGEGGLRDLHGAVWIARVKFKARTLHELVIKGVMSEEEEQQLFDYYDRLWRIRNQLHYLSNRKNEQLHFDQQEAIARFLGYRGSRKARAVEQFMQDFYSFATQVEHFSSSLIGRVTQRDQSVGLIGQIARRNLEHGFYLLRKELRISQPEVFAEEPKLMMHAFLLAQRHGVPLSFQLKTAIRDHLHLVNDRFRRSRLVNKDFFAILKGPHSVGATLRDMHHLRFLNQYIPEFKRIYCMVQHDAYHIYTVDIHSIFAVEQFFKLLDGHYAKKKPLLTRLANDVEKKELLILAILFHDIGKGEGKNHSEKGAEMVKRISRRFGLNREDSDRLEFLVLHHLDMPHIALRRDLHDDKLIEQFANTMGMTENLKMLYLLTFTDLKAVGPDVWSEWKGFLLQELYEKTYGALERSGFLADIRSERLRNRKRKVRQTLEEDYGERKVKKALKNMGQRYLLSHRSNEIVDHLKLFFSRGKKTLALQINHQPEHEYSEIWVSTLDVPGLFSKLAGVMAAHNVNILGAQIYTRMDGEAFDILQVRSGSGTLITDARRWKKIEEDMVAAIEGRLRLDEVVAKACKPSVLAKTHQPKFPSRIDFDNHVSTDHTVIDIITHDRVGLLYVITNALLELGLYIGVSKISTKVDQAADTFYVQDIFSQKVVDPEKLDEIRTMLLERIDSLPLDG